VEGKFMNMENQKLPPIFFNYTSLQFTCTAQQIKSEISSDGMHVFSPQFFA
jgi:hypothetical protein